MADWFGNLLAVFIAGVVLFIIAGVNLRVQQSAIATIQYRAGKVETVDLMKTLDRDLRNIGSNYPAFDLPGDSAIVAWDTSGTTKVFEFLGQEEPGLPPETIRCEWSVAGTVEVDETVKDAYRVERYVDGDLTAMSAGALTRFDVGLLASDGTPASSAADTRQVAVRLSLVSSLGTSSTVEETDWNTVIRPIALARNDF